MMENIWKVDLKSNCLILVLLISSLNENGLGISFVFGRTWPRSYNGNVLFPSTGSARQDVIHSENTTNTTKLSSSTPSSSSFDLTVSKMEAELESIHDGNEHSSLNNSQYVRLKRNDTEGIENLCKDAGIISNSLHLFAHPVWCTKYVECGPLETTYIRTCGPGTVFNSASQVCDWPRNVDECKDTGENINSLDERIRRHRRDINTSGSRGKFGRIIPDSKYCNKYKILSSTGGVVSTHTCGQGALFNPISLVCDFADNVDCSSRIADFGTYGCSKGDYYKAPHPDICNKFVECDNGNLAVKACPPATLYSRDEEKCDHSYKVQCRKKVSLRYDIFHQHTHRNKRSYRELRQSDSQQNKLNLACDYNYIAPHPQNCNQFVECEQKRLFVKNCGPGTAFNSRLGQCDWPYNVREPDSTDCTLYRQCNGRRFELRQCRQGQIFDDQKGKCINVPQYIFQQCKFNRYTTTTTTEIYQPTITPKPTR